MKTASKTLLLFISFFKIFSLVFYFRFLLSLKNETQVTKKVQIIRHLLSVVTHQTSAIYGNRIVEEEGMVEQTHVSTSTIFLSEAV
jgi:hypothetical protein